MGSKVYIDGKLVVKEDAKISVFDHGLLYGDGVFEGIRSYGGLIFKLSEHLDRLFESAQTIMLKIPMGKKELEKAIVETLKVNGLRDAYIRLIITRGFGDLGLDPRKCKSPSVIIIADKIALYPKKFYDKGLDLITVPTRRNLSEAINPQVKSLNYLNNIMAKIEAVNSGYEEALMLSSEGYVLECTGDNIFIYSSGRLYTPPFCLGVLKGITRQAVIEISQKLKIPVSEHVMTRHELYNAEEAFLTGTAAEIIPVVKIDGRVIGDGKPGKVTLKLLSQFKKLTKADGVRY